MQYPNILKVFYLIKRKDENESENEEQYNDSEEEDFSSSDELTTCDYYIIEELCKYDLEKFIHISQKKRNGINSQTKKKIINQIVDAMCHCHSQEKKIIHRVFFFSNILITENEDVKICFFFFAKILENELNNTPGVFFFLYMAPELYMNDGYIFFFFLDIYSFGYILCYILFFFFEFETASLQEKAKNIFFFFDNVITEIEARNLIYQCWELQPENRPSFEEIKSRINLWSFE
ncbi:hypothetical protein TRFO_38476 [Tritrichomonas foetus]|uniref:Protein kinase domain-containing protein n=1 Tax=Tritrichomonas foetus TaxID=1144522 RepID=A0A1J4J8C4_9EUKA|nr:hypothetical protein TRFO_38476 [Tritrichomonas foetus]|eukprot:OHS95442.1 hypothetical protein TRFO_38476 [Tritrichomonas foetus]